MSPKTLTLLWIVTALAALSLLAATISLAARANAAGDARAEAVILSQGESVYLRASPGASQRILTVLEPGTPVTVLNEEMQNGRIWYFVETQTLAGWVPGGNVRLAETRDTK